MKPHPLPVYSSRPAFALISVLALVSLAALTATAFLASARLERSATRPIGDITRLQMALNTGKECATEVINRIGEPNWNFVTTYWRTAPTNDIGYLFLGKRGGTTANPLAWPYTCGFTPATWTNLDSNSVIPYVTATNLICQASFSNDITSFMNGAGAVKGATSGFTTLASVAATSKVCTLIPMLGGRTSPPVGWVYIKQDIRTNPSSTNTANLPVSRFAYFIEDLGGLIDAERMCGINNRPSGTNAEEISLANLTGSSATNINLANYTIKRSQYLTPGMLLSSNGGVLTNINDLRYFASRLRYCAWDINQNTNWDRVPSVPISRNTPYYPTNCGSLKVPLNKNLDAAGWLVIYNAIMGFPNFIERAGGWSKGSDYVGAIAANIIDYADDDPLPTTTGGSVGWDAYPLPTQIFDQMVWNKDMTNLTVTTYLQLWNQSTKTSPAVTYTLNNNFQDTYADGTRIQPTAWTANISVPQLNPNQGTITNIPWPIINLDKNKIGTTGSFPINGGSDRFFNNTFSLTLGSAPIAVMKTKYERKAKTLQNMTPEWSGCLPALRYDELSPAILTTGDPRMLNYLTNSGGNVTNAVNYSGNSVWASYGQTRNASSGFTDRWSANPMNWPDGTNSLARLDPVSGTQPGSVDATPPVGVFTPPGVALCKLSPTNIYTNITELGNIFDPIQWAPSAKTTISQQSDYVNYDIASGSWNPNSMYGGGQTLRIGRAEHSRFAFTNLGGTYPVPSLGTSAAGLLDLFCTTNAYNWAGKININTAPPAVLAALAGGITLSKDGNMKPSTGPANAAMVSAFTNGVIKFRSLYPFITPSQLSFISTNYGTTGWTNSAVWKQSAVFSSDPASQALSGVISLNDEGREEWFSKIYNLTCVQSFNYRIYVVAQLTDTNGNPKGAMMRKYYQIYLNYNAPTPDPKDNKNPDKFSPSVSPLPTYEAFY